MNVVAEAKYSLAAIIIGLLIIYFIQHFERYLPECCTNRSILDNTTFDTGRSPTSSFVGRCSPHDPRTDITRRARFGALDNYVFGYPSKGGVIALKNPTIPDFDFLGLSRMYPPTTRFSDPRTEDEFCKKLLLLGAKWYDSLSRFYFLRCAGGEAPDTLCIEALENGSEPLPTVRERTWVSIAWPSAGGLVVAEWNTLMYGYGKDDDMFLPDEELGRLRLCKNMDEKALILMDWFEGKEIEDIQAYKGNSWLRIWDSKVGGEHGKMENTWHNGIEEK